MTSTSIPTPRVSIPTPLVATLPPTSLLLEGSGRGHESGTSNPADARTPSLTGFLLASENGGQKAEAYCRGGSEDDEHFFLLDRMDSFSFDPPVSVGDYESIHTSTPGCSTVGCWQPNQNNNPATTATSGMSYDGAGADDTDGDHDSGHADTMTLFSTLFNTTAATPAPMLKEGEFAAVPAAPLPLQHLHQHQQQHHHHQHGPSSPSSHSTSSSTPPLSPQFQHKHQQHPHIIHMAPSPSPSPSRSGSGSGLSGRAERRQRRKGVSSVSKSQARAKTAKPAQAKAKATDDSLVRNQSEVDAALIRPNNKLAADMQYEKYFTMEVVEINRLHKKGVFDKEECKRIKAARRRYLNRGYACDKKRREQNKKKAIVTEAEKARAEKDEIAARYEDVLFRARMQQTIIKDLASVHAAVSPELQARIQQALDPMFLTALSVASTPTRWGGSGSGNCQSGDSSSSGLDDDDDDDYDDSYAGSDLGDVQSSALSSFTAMEED